MKTISEIEDLYAEAAERAHKSTKFPGMTFEEGVRDALEWMLHGGDNPLDD